MNPEDDIGIVLDQIFRREHGRILASLISSFADFDLAEEALGDAQEAAVRHWPQAGIPEKPGVWLLEAARRRAIERIRRNRLVTADQAPLDSLWSNAENGPDGYPDERLKLLFLCAHPSLTQEDRVVLTLHAMAGLTTGEIAQAYLIPFQTLTQRLARAKRKVRDAALDYEVPPLEKIGDRIDAILMVIYQIFTDGFASITGDSPLGEGLCSVALGLGRSLEALVGSNMVAVTRGCRAEIKGIVALMLIQGSRRKARRGPGFDLIPLGDGAADQWDLGALAEGKALLSGAQALGKAGPYQIQAAVEALHAVASEGAPVDWSQIVVLYRKMLQWSPGPLVMFQYAVALDHVKGSSEGLELLEPLESSLESYGPYHLARAELLAQAKRWDEARHWFQSCLELTRNSAERRAVQAKMGDLPVPDKGSF